MTTAPSMADALARLWTKFLPEIESRLTVLEVTAQALQQGPLSTEQRAQAHADAHKLAGSLGTFGLQRGTELARQAETLLADDSGGLAEDASARLSLWVTELRTLVDARK